MTDIQVRHFNAVHVHLDDDNQYVNISLAEKFDFYQADPDTALVIRLPIPEATYLASSLQQLLIYLNQLQSQTD